MNDPELRERFHALVDERDDSDWRDISRRAGLGDRRPLVLAVAGAGVVVALLVAPGIGLGGRILGLFRGEEKRVPLAKLAEHDRAMVLTQFCRRVTLVTSRGRAPDLRCREGAPTVTEIANNGRRAYWKIAYRGGPVCVASGPARPRRSIWSEQFETMSCGDGAAGQVPSPSRPITTDVVFTRSFHGRTKAITLRGLAGAGIAAVGLVDGAGHSVKTAVRGQIYSLGRVGDRGWRAVVAYDAAGTEVYREPLSGPPPVAHHRAQHAPPRPPAPARDDSVRVQHAEISGATADVYASGRIVLRFTSSGNRYEFLRRHPSGDGRITVECGLVAFGAGRWAGFAAGVYAPVGREIEATIPSLGSGIRPPFDQCSIRGHYGRRWDEHVGYRSALEVPFTAEAKRFFDERAAARRLAYFIRSPKIAEIRRAMKRGGSAPSTSAIASRFDSSVIPLASRTASPPEGKLGVWSDGAGIIVASQIADDGRRMYVTLDHGRIGAHNLHALAFVF